MGDWFAIGIGGGLDRNTHLRRGAGDDGARGDLARAMIDGRVDWHQAAERLGIACSLRHDLDASLGLRYKEAVFRMV